MFDQIDIGEWFPLIYNGGGDLTGVHIDINVQGKFNDDKKFLGRVDLLNVM